jgi:N-dimethylarginine dimethylaminohydrolase
LLFQPAADRLQIVLGQIIEINTANCPHRVPVLHIVGEFVRVREDYAIGCPFCEPKEWRDLGVGEIGSL